MFFLYLCQEPSVALAVQILDGTPLRPGGKIPMSVSQAKFEQKGWMTGAVTFNFDMVSFWSIFVVVNFDIGVSDLTIFNFLYSLALLYWQASIAITQETNL